MILPQFSFFFLFFVFLFFVFFFFEKARESNLLKKSLEFRLLSIRLPQTVEKTPDFKEYLKKVEQFYESLINLFDKKEKNFPPPPFLVFEIAVHRIGEEINFYAACPRSLAEFLERQILTFWPEASIEKTIDYNIFNPSGISVGSFGKLAKSLILPLKSPLEFSLDPLLSVFSELSKLAKEGEGAAIQLILKKSKRNIKGEIQRVINNLKQGVPLERALIGKVSQFSSSSLPPLTTEQQELISLLDRRISKQFFDVNLRIVTSAPSKERAEQILSQLENTLSQFNSPKFNQLVFKRVSGRKAIRFFYNFSFRIFQEKESFSLSSEDLSLLFHFPLPSLELQKVKWLKTKSIPAPINLPTEGIIIGKNIYHGEERIVRIMREDRRRHFYIIGQTGTGKSGLIQEMIRQDIENGEGVALIDPHGDLAERVLGLIPEERLEDVVFFDPADPERAIGLNMLEFDPTFPESRTFIVNELLEIFEKLYNLKALGFGGPVFEQYMRNALLLVMEDPESGSTLIEVPRVLADASFRARKLSFCKNIVVKNFWELEAEKAGGEAALSNLVPYITSKLNLFIANDLVRPIIGQEKSTIDFKKIMNEGKIFIANLAKGKLGELNSYLLGMIIVGKILISAFSRVNLPEEERRDFYLYIDEFHSVTTNTIASALAEARKFRLNLILAHQFIGQLNEETKKAIFGNVGSILAFRVGPDDAKYLSLQFGPAFSENDLVNFDNFHGAIKILIQGVSSSPFSILTFPPKKENPKIREKAKFLSREKYSRKREEVEREIYEKLTKIY